MKRENKEKYLMHLTKIHTYTLYAYIHRSFFKLRMAYLRFSIHAKNDFNSKYEMAIMKNGINHDA